MEILIATGIMGIVAVILLQITKDQMKTQAKGEIDNALAQAEQEILSLIVSPAHCNANFAKLPTTIAGTPALLRIIPPLLAPSLNKCKVSTVGACRSVPVSPYTDYDLRFPAYHASWEPNGWREDNTKISNRVRISKLTYDVQAGPVVLPADGDGTIQTLRLYVTFQYRTVPHPVTNKTVHDVEKSYSALVVVNDTTVAGCPKTSGSPSLF